MTNPATTEQDVPRRVLVLAHTRRDEARDVARAFVKEPERARDRRASAAVRGRGPGAGPGGLRAGGRA
ncbi:hypothetical protein G5V59_05070 [Nocardioides sp. W3-2-3]|uniref:hypothetical protein n=1 Tax=Nocardioides convexus TaxID=2712224 RepID=UPI00241832D9|nr:hypothetical protein [Nocardioides convexus]NGZ99860.1 hypothetical protein [Nocardioides convexus]